MTISLLFSETIEFKLPIECTYDVTSLYAGSYSNKYRYLIENIGDECPKVIRQQ